MNKSPTLNNINANSDETTYQILIDRYLVEWQRTSNIENKAICIIGFIGLLMVFSVNLGLDHLSEIANNFQLLKLYLFCIILLLLAFISTVGALFFANKRMRVLDVEYLMREYIYKNKPVLKVTYQELSEEIIENKRYNIIKNLLLTFAIVLFVISCAFLLIFTVWYSIEQNHDIMSNISNNLSNTNVKDSDKIYISQNNLISHERSNVSLNNNSYLHQIIYKPYCVDIIHRSKSY